MSTNDLMAWLGPAAEELTDEQIEEVARAADDIAVRYPDPDDADQRHAALAAEVQMIMGDITPADAARELMARRRAALLASVAAQQIAVRLVRHGMTKMDAAKAAGISRPTLDAAIKS